MLAVMTVDPLFVYANLAEAGLWTVLGITVAARVGRSGMPLAVALLAFGVSDVVESRTGAWYDPWWLLVWKTLCVLAIVTFGLRLYRRRRVPTAGGQNP